MISRRAAECAVGLTRLGLLLPGRLPGQMPDTTLGDTLLLAARRSGPSRDSLALFLRRKGQYRIALLPASTSLRVVPVSGKAEAFVVRAREGQGGRSSVFEV
ncbi:MAG TPA: hypothetical protein VNJ71_06190 [Gemmatimonadales bacterium]|jgi:hypothetical protein|nr:hypothetical protein [Gemmatimonadales bacterium]